MVEVENVSLSEGDRRITLVAYTHHLECITDLYMFCLIFYLTLLIMILDLANVMSVCVNRYYLYFNLLLKINK